MQINEPDESSRFYRLTQNVMAQLAGAQGEGIDVTVSSCLERLGEYFGVDSVSLGGISKSGELMPALYLWGQLPPKETMLAGHPSPGQEMVARFNRDGYFIYNRLEDLDELPQYQEHTRQMGIPAAVFWKHHDKGSWVEGMALGSKNPKIWPDGIVERIGAVGEVLFNALYRRRAEAETERLRQFEQIVAATASEFVHASPDQVDARVEQALQRLCKCVDADLGTLLQWNDSEKSTMKVSHEWDADFVCGPHFRGTVLVDEYPWLATRLRESEPLLIHNPDDFPPEADAERATCRRIGIRSILWAPFVAAHGLQGYIALSTVNRPGAWLENTVPQLGLVGNVLANAIERQRADHKLLQAYAEIRQLKDYLESENLTLREEIKATFDEEELVGKSHAFQTVIHQVEQVARTDSTVLLLSETGTGKSLIARLLHRQSRRKDRPLVTVNCAALPAELIESELFGHEKGAFTGAVDRKIGRFELADGATIFLDEIGDLSAHTQVRLLRVLQEREFERVGGAETVRINVRVIAATNRDLEDMVRQGVFRQDLYYRLNVFPIHVPPLRERRTDILELANFFVEKYSTENHKYVRRISTPAIDMMMSYHWPGNVRELENCIERAILLTADDVVHGHHLPPTLQTAEASSTPMRGTLEETLDRVEREMLIEALKNSRGNKAKAARELGITERLIGLRVRKHRIDPKLYRA